MGSHFLSCSQSFVSFSSNMAKRHETKWWRDIAWLVACIFPVCTDNIVTSSPSSAWNHQALPAAPIWQKSATALANNTTGFRWTFPVELPWKAALQGGWAGPSILAWSQYRHVFTYPIQCSFGDFQPHFQPLSTKMVLQLSLHQYRHSSNLNAPNQHFPAHPFRNPSGCQFFHRSHLEEIMRRPP